jgi:hypothetical protein
LHELDDDSQAALAHLNPSDQQLRMLSTAAAVRRFLVISYASEPMAPAPAPAAAVRAVNAKFDPVAVSALYQTTAPLQPSLRWLPATVDGFRAEYSFGDKVGIGSGQCKREAKAHAAGKLVNALKSSSPSHS